MSLCTSPEKNIHSASNNKGNLMHLFSKQKTRSNQSDSRLDEIKDTKLTVKEQIMDKVA